MNVTKSYEFESIRYFKFGYGPIGRPIGYVHIYYVDGLLIDSGQSSMRKTILSTTSSLPVAQLLITHHHEDHSGNIAVIKEQFNCEAYASALCCEAMKSPPPLSLAQKMTWGPRPAYPHLKPISNEISTPNHRFQIIPIPGHAEDMVALYEPERRWLFSADLYINSYIGYFLNSESVVRQIHSIRKVLSLDFKVMLCSHHPRLKDGRQKLEEKCAFLEDFHAKVINLHHKGYAPKEIMKHLQLKENLLVKLLSNGLLSKLNMIKSSIRDDWYENTN